MEDYKSGEDIPISEIGKSWRYEGEKKFFFFFQAEDGIRDDLVTGVQTCALPISVAFTE